MNIGPGSFLLQRVLRSRQVMAMATICRCEVRVDTVCGSQRNQDRIEKHKTIRLSVGRVMRLERQMEGVEIQMRGGVIWLTGSPANGDEIYYTGDRFVLGVNGPFILEVFEDAEMVLSY